MGDPREHGPNEQDSQDSNERQHYRRWWSGSRAALACARRRRRLYASWSGSRAGKKGKWAATNSARRTS